SLVVCLIFYFLLSNEHNPARAPKKQDQPPSSRVARRDPGFLGRAAELPPILMVQNESFFDARRIHPSIPPGILRNWDAVGAASAYRGRLTVPAWGANTMRTEFAVLT